MRVETYVELIHPGSFFSETSCRRVESRAPIDVSAKDLRAFGYRFFDVRVFSATREDGEMFETREARSNVSRWTYAGEKLARADVELLERADGKRWEILLSNMRCNGIEHVVRTRFGQCIPLDPGDVVVPDPAVGPLLVRVGASS
jgi:hypothetical protein